MDIVKPAIEWAKAEVFSAQFFILFGILFVLASIGFWQLGRSEIAKHYMYSTAVAGALLFVIGAGLVYANVARMHQFEGTHGSHVAALAQSETTRAQRTIAEYKMVVFKAIPLLIAAASLLIMALDNPMWRAISITTIAFLSVLLLVDSNASARMDAYYQQLTQQPRE